MRAGSTRSRGSRSRWPRSVPGWTRCSSAVPRPIRAESERSMSEVVKPLALSKKDFESDQDVRWCPGCGDYAILSAVQKMLADVGARREDTVFVSGIGCSSRFPYYM